MIRFTLLCFMLIIGLPSFSQTPSDCTVPEVLQELYDKDVKGLAIKRMQELNSPDFARIEIPQTWQDSILEGMAAIFNAPDLPESDSVFRIHCVHDMASSPALFGFIVGVETSSPIAQAWEAGNTLTGNAILDTLLTQYNFSLQNYISFGAGVLYTDQILNLFALADSIVGSVPGVLYGEPDYLIGGAGRISYQSNPDGKQFYEFRLEWNDCFDGCDNFYTWEFSVSPDCTVEFLGTEEGGVFGLDDLPDPVNCLMTSASTDPSMISDLKVFPNPATDRLFIENPPQKGRWRIFDAQGHLQLTGDFRKPEIDLKTLHTGAFWIQWTNTKGIHLGSKAFYKE